MKFIAEGGLTSKNVPPNSRDSILLTMASNLASGICLNVYFTRDEEIVIATYEQVKLITKGDNDFANTESKKVLTYDIGSKVKSHYLRTLDSALNIYKNSTKLMLLKVESSLLDNNIFKEKFISLLEKYPTVNTYILSSNKSRLDELINSSIKSRIGIMITKNNIENLNSEYDFYTLKVDVVSNDIVRDKRDKNKDVFIDEVNTVEQVNYLNTIINNYYLKYIYIISSNIGPILSTNSLTSYTT